MSAQRKSEAARDYIANLSPVPASHRLDYYSVLGTLKGLYFLLGDPLDVAERRAIESLMACRPKRRPDAKRGRS